MQVVIFTLEKIELTDPAHKFQKVSVALKYGESTKSIPKPRFIRSKVANFYGEKISISSTDPNAKNILLSVYGIGKEEELIGEIKIEVKQLEKKQGANERFEIEQDKFYIEFEAMYSSNLGMSPRSLDRAVDKDLKSTSDNASTSERKQERVYPAYVRKQSQKSNKEIEQSSLNKLKALQKAQLSSSPKPISRKNSNRQLNRPFNSSGNEQDNKSDIAERPSQRKIQRTSKRENQVEVAKSQSAYRPSRDNGKQTRERSVTPPKVSKSEKSGQVTPRGKSRAQNRERRVEVKEEAKGYEQKDYIQFLVIAVIALVLGVAVRKL